MLTTVQQQPPRHPLLLQRGPRTEQRSRRRAFNLSPRSVFHLRCENPKSLAEAPVPHPHVGSPVLPSPPSHPSVPHRPEPRFAQFFCLWGKVWGLLRFARGPETARRCWRGREGAPLRDAYDVSPSHPKPVPQRHERRGTGLLARASGSKSQTGKTVAGAGGRSAAACRGTRRRVARVPSRHRQDPSPPRALSGSAVAVPPRRGGNRGFSRQRHVRRMLKGRAGTVPGQPHGAGAEASAPRGCHAGPRDAGAANAPSE